MNTILNTSINTKNTANTSNFSSRIWLFASIWLSLILINYFRVDLLLFSAYGIDVAGLEELLPVAIILVSLATFFLVKWYYKLLLLFYPIYFFAWQLPNVLLGKGKIFLLLNYLSFLYNRVRNLKQSIVHVFVVVTVLSLFLIFSGNWIKYSAIALVVYLYTIYMYSFVRKAFEGPGLFGEKIESFLQGLLNTDKEKKYALINFIKKEEVKAENPVHIAIEQGEHIDDEAVDNSFGEAMEDNGINPNTAENTESKEEKELVSFLFLKLIFDALSKRLNSFVVMKSYIINLLYKLFIFGLVSVLVLWFVNYQLYAINSNSFAIVGNVKSIEFLNYTIHSIAFATVDNIMPASIISQVVQVACNSVLVIMLVFFIGFVFFSFRRDKLIANMDLAAKICQEQSGIIQEELREKYGDNVDNVMQSYASTLFVQNILKKSL